MPFDSTPITSPAIEMLRRGKALIETRGLARGRAEDLDGRICAVGGITRQSRRWERGMSEALEYLARAVPTSVELIADWNDAPGRTVNVVVAVYDRAIDLAVADQLPSY